MYDCKQAIDDINKAFPVSGKIAESEQEEKLLRALDHILGTDVDEDGPCENCGAYYLNRKREFEDLQK